MVLESHIDRSRRFEEAQHDCLVTLVPEWKIILALAYEGPMSMYELSSRYRFSYPPVHRATRKLEERGWLRVVDRRLSQKNMMTKIYGLTIEGLLWVFTRTNKLSDGSASIVGEYLKKALVERDVSLVRNLHSQTDVLVHLEFFFDIDKVAEKNVDLLPLVFGNWRAFRKIFPFSVENTSVADIAVSVLSDFYYGHPRMLEYGTLDAFFTSELCYAVLVDYAESASGIGTKDRRRILSDLATAFQSSPQLLALCREACDQAELGFEKALAFVQQVKAKIGA